MSPDGRLLAFLSFETAASTGVHAATAELLTLPWPPPGALQALLALLPSHLCKFLACPGVLASALLAPAHTLYAAGDLAAARRTVVPAQPASQGSASGWEEDFPGIYALALPEQPFLSARTLLLTTQWRSRRRVLAIDLNSGRMQAGRSTHSQAVLACTNGETWALRAPQQRWLFCSPAFLWPAMLMPVVWGQGGLQSWTPRPVGNQACRSGGLRHRLARRPGHPIRSAASSQAKAWLVSPGAS